MKWIIPRSMYTDCKQNLGGLDQVSLWTQYVQKNPNFSVSTENGKFKIYSSFHRLINPKLEGTQEYHKFLTSHRAT